MRVDLYRLGQQREALSQEAFQAVQCENGGEEHADAVLGMLDDADGTSHKACAGRKPPQSQT